MTFFRRLKDGLVSPMGLVEGVQDKKLFTFFFFIVLVILFALPSLIILGATDLYGYEERVELRKEFISSNKDIPYYILDGKLYHDTGDNESVYKMVIHNDTVIFITTNDEFVPDFMETPMSIVIRSDGVYYYTAMAVKVLSYADYPELNNNLDLSDARVKSSEFWNIVNGVIEKIVNQYQGTVKTVLIVYSFISAAITLGIITLAMTVFQRFYVSNAIKFTKLWQVIIYATVPFVIGNMLSELYNFSVFYYIGLILTISYSMRLSRHILMRGGNNEL